MAKQAAELEDSQNNNSNDKNSNDNNSSSNLNSSSSTGQRAAPSNNPTPEQYVGSNKRITQEDGNSQMDSKKHVNDGENLGITTKDQNTRTNQSPSQATGNSSQQAIISDDNKQSDSQISQREELNLEQQAPSKNIVKLQEDTKVAEEKLAELLSNISNLDNEYTKKKLAFEKLEQREAQLLKQPKIKANAFSQQAQQNRAGSQDDSKVKKESVANSQQQVKVLVQKEVESKDPQAKVKVPETMVPKQEKALAKASEKTQQQTADLTQQQNVADQAAKDELAKAKAQAKKNFGDVKKDLEGKLADLAQQAKDAQDKFAAAEQGKKELKKSLEDAKQLTETEKAKLDDLAKTHALETDNLKKSLEDAKQLTETEKAKLDDLAKAHALETDNLKKSLED
ncbi:MAG: hypothetical protein LN568_06075, partial [Rickettsia endosymbiont of Pseudomimeciton antennatum]|nr:hypothetical protein [Rickettsia endosymbiont of Pseudomimeciton antennatum]